MCKKNKIGLMVSAALLAMAGEAGASGFALIEQGGGLGNAFAGGAASAEDASTVFFNPAGMSRLNGTQISLGGAFIKPSAKFNGTASGLAPLQTAGSGTGGDAGGWAFVPNLYTTHQINDQLHVGLGVNAPFGLQTKYNSDWMGRFQGVKSKLETVNVNPSVSYDVGDSFSVGAGVSYQYVSGKLTNAVNYSGLAFSAGGGALLGAIGGPGKEGLSTLTGNDTAFGYNFGALFKIGEQTRIGAAYRSKIKYHLSGDVRFDNRPALLAAALPDQPVSLAITMPDSFSMSAFHQFSDQLDIMADATWTGWSEFKTLEVKRANGTPLGAATPENWDDTWRFSVGTAYHYNDQWTARAGVAYDQSPVSTTYRTVRIPDADRTWLTLGGQYKPSPNSTVDFGYAHLFVSNAKLNQSAAANPDLAGKGLLVGNYDSRVDIVSVQYGYQF